MYLVTGVGGNSAIESLYVLKTLVSAFGVSVPTGTLNKHPRAGGSYLLFLTSLSLRGGRRESAASPLVDAVPTERPQVAA